MNIVFRKYLVNNLIIALILAILGNIFFVSFLKTYYHPIFPVLLIYTLIVNLLAFLVVTQKKTVNTQLLSIVGKLFAVKFFSYLLVAILFLVLVEQRTYRISFVLVLFCLYFAFTIIELTALTKFFKSEEK